MVGPLDRKLLRDLARMKGQAAAIAAVIGLGVLMQVMMGGLVNTLEETRAAYYDRYRLADVFAQVTRAPNRMAERIARIPGVAAIEGNGRQFCPAANKRWARQFPSMFNITDGTVGTAALNGPGLGF